ncbi:hypothetical protein KFD70_25670 [Bacillus pfraonensis]|uniref:hypothetical protein n=1 Tax=Bacillus TaxID=1386 RepID=UPI0030130AA8
MKKVLQSLTITSLVLGGGFFFGFSEQASAANPQSGKVEMEKSKVDHKAPGISTKQGEKKLSKEIGVQDSSFEFYDDRNFNNLLFTMYPDQWIEDLGFFDVNDKISSVIIPPRSAVVLYYDKNFSGHSKTIKNRYYSSYKKVDLYKEYFDDTTIDCSNSVRSLQTYSLD